ncbi:MAG: restriction endonuclease subunit S [Bacteroidetes bacterium]|nr:restriction endonuclease subunit S [Bacteroidota bacterium]
MEQKITKLGKINPEFDVFKLKSALEKNDAGDWGDEPVEGNAIGILRSTNFTNQGILDLSDVAHRTLKPQKLAEKKLSEGEIIIERSGGSDSQPVGRVGFITSEIADNNYAFANFIQRIAFDETIEPKYLYYCLQQMYEMGITASMQYQTTGIRNLDWKLYTKSILPKPKPEEQKAIATILSKVDEAIKATEYSIKAAEKLKKSLMQNLLTGKLKPDGTWRNEDEFYKHEKFGNCPVGWHWGRLSEIADVIAGQSPSGEYYNEDGIGTPMLNGPTEFTDLHPIPVQFTTKVTKLCRIGDILFTVRGSSTGRMNIADQEYCIGRGIAAIRAKEGSDIDFIYYTLVTISEKILAEAKGAGTTFPNVSRGELLKKWVLIPDTDQSEISAKIKSVDAFLNEKERKVITTRRLKKSLMQNLLTGKVRVDINKIENILADATV